MLKYPDSLKDTEDRAVRALRALLENVPAIQVESIKATGPRDPGFDIVAELIIGGRQHRLICEVKSVGQPRYVHGAIFKLRRAMEHFDPSATPVFIAPYLSPESQALCREYDVGFVDLAGNARLAFDTIYIERQVDAKPAAVQRGLKSIFKPKSAQILRVLLRAPFQSWRVVDLAEASDVSLGLVSNVRTELIDREWAEVTEDGMRLLQPRALLDAWREVYEAPAGERLNFYTTLHGKALEKSSRDVLSPDPDKKRAVFASFSAAHWLAPYGRVPTQYFYAESAAIERLRDALKLSPAASGANVVITVPKEEGPFLDIVQPAPGAVCTSPVQTYLDLAIAGERGEEAAEHLRTELLSWQK
ncbi:type IV toxin-antitoxin system AbiEi family antitoxin [Bradyrhizobium sp. USDA 4506]